MYRTLFLSILSVALAFLFIHAISKPKEQVNNSGELVDLIEYTPWYVSLVDSLGLSKGALYAAYENYNIAKDNNLLQNDSIITIVDFNIPSTQHRLFVIDIKNFKLLAHSLVAHGQNSGKLYAKRFSNKPNSHMSSLGLFKTSNTYIGKHGYSLRLDGLEDGKNDKARSRAIVIHGASYVSKNYIERTGRIGRSFGCPALPTELNTSIINLIKNGSCFYIYHPSGVI